MVGDENPPVSFSGKTLGQFETLQKVEQIQHSANRSVSTISACEVPSVPLDKTGISHVHSAAVEEAALWLADHRSEVGSAPIPALRSRFGLTILEAIEAGKLAHGLQYARSL